MQSILQYRRFEARLAAQILANESASQDSSTRAGSRLATCSTEAPSHDQGRWDDPHAHAEDLHGQQSERAQYEQTPYDLEGQENSERALDAASSNTPSYNCWPGRGILGVELRKGEDDEDEAAFVVGYETPSDDMDPHNWSYTKRLYSTILVALIAMIVSMASAIDSSVISQAAQDFGVSKVVESMATGLFLVAFGFGAVFAGPMSENLGRNPVYVGTMAIYMIFIMASALAPNIAAQLIFRFIAGFFGSTPLTCAGGTLSDLWDPVQRIWAFPIFASSAFIGPLIGPIMAGWIGQSSAVGWRWTEWVTFIGSGVVLALVVFTQPETHAPTLLRWRAHHLRSLTRDKRFVSQSEIGQEPFLARLGQALWRPVVLTIHEPVIVLITLYMTVVYIVLFTFLIGYDFIFGETYGVSQGITGTCFAGIIVGVVASLGIIPLMCRWGTRDLQAIKERGGDRLLPEFRLWFCMLGGALAIPVSLFWMGWTARSNISIWSPLAASVLFGYGILCVFVTCYQYIIDMYEVYAASALTSMTLIRYIAAGGMTIAGLPIYENLGVAYTLTIMGSVSAALVPVPYLFYIYGPTIRSKSKYAAKNN